MQVHEAVVQAVHAQTASAVQAQTASGSSRGGRTLSASSRRCERRKHGMNSRLQELPRPHQSGTTV
eukprot:2432640-Prymnesium_polylepis.1